jgi:cellulose synthase/poly-beta-1,6-N-acetylglucosamine synthase-like glycosyltransferase
VDDGSTDSTFIAAKHAQANAGKLVQVYRTVNGGKSSALNYALAHSKGELVATLDSDCIMQKDSLRKLVGQFADPSVMAATAAVKVHSPSNLLQRLQSVEYLFILFSRKLLASIDSVYVTPGPLSMFRRKVFAKIGGFKQGNIMEDQEFALRLQSHHYRIVSSSDAVVLTRAPATLGQLARQRVRWNRGGVRNLWDYAFMVHPSYGDLGVLVLPLWIASIVAVFAVFALTVNSIIDGQYALWLTYGFFIPFYYGIGPIFVLSMFCVILGGLWLALGLWYFRDDYVGGPVTLAVYFLLYPFLSGLFWLDTLIKELKGEPLKW